MFIEKYMKDFFIRMNFRDNLSAVFLTVHEKSDKYQYSLLS